MRYEYIINALTSSTEDARLLALINFLVEMKIICSYAVDYSVSPTLQVHTFDKSVLY